MDLTPYFATVALDDPEELLGDWRWLIGPGSYALHRASAVGDLFLIDGDGAVHFLNTSDGTFDRAAGSVAELDLLLEDRHQRRNLLSTHLVRALRDGGKVLGPGQCYSRDVPLFLGGSEEIEAIEPTSLVVHVSVLGQLHRQARGLAS